MINAPVKQLLILIDRHETWHERPLSEAIVAALQKQGVAGASAFEGMMGFGWHGQFHRQGFFGVAAEKPIAIIAIDAEPTLRAAVEVLRPMVREGLIVLSDVEVLHQGPSRSGRDGTA
ncbi:DUF190 domain-containing protein [Luteitalea sp.]|uniref:DUF190 domain-containing protein n=1 Tax=Luteitalea sp. TaxID=2004800 RepID=UPI0025B9013E|nr:DUF190 domain-containing protein [Luteitalea sp.]